MEMSKPNILISHFFIRNNKQFLEFIVAISKYVNIYIDSGAFSNSRIEQGILKADSPITLDEYIKVCRDYYHGNVWQYIALDVIRDKEKTERNLHVMLDAGLKPTPVITTTEDVERCLELVKYNRRICIAGAAFNSSTSTPARVTEAHRLTNGDALLHTLGFTVHPTIFKYPIATSDSSSLTSGSRYGTISIYDRIKGMSTIDWKKAGTHKNKDVQFYLKRHGVSPDQMKDVDNYRTGKSIPSLFTVNAYIQFLEHCKEYDLGLFLAVPTIGWVVIIASVYYSCLVNSHFDYKIAVEKYVELSELNKQDKQKFTYAIQHIFSMTNQKTILTDEQSLLGRFPINAN